MKIIISVASILALSADTANAFGVVPSSKTALQRSKLAAATVDTASLVDNAMEASKNYGATSPEARLAWEAVEEIRESDYR